MKSLISCALFYYLFGYLQCGIIAPKNSLDLSQSGQTEQNGHNTPNDHASKTTSTVGYTTKSPTTEQSMLKLTSTAKISTTEQPMLRMFIQHKPATQNPPRECQADGCQFLPCLNNGVCRKTPRTFCHWHCECTPGWTGVHCDKPYIQERMSKTVNAAKVIERSKSPNDLMNMILEKFV